MANPSTLREHTEAPASRSVVRRLPLPDSDTSLVEALRARHPDAAAALFDRHGAHVRRVLVRVLGVDAEIPDVLHDVFVVALDSIHRLDKSAAVRGWLTSIAIHSARGLIRKRGRRRVLGMLLAHSTERTATVANAELTESLRATYRTLEQLSADERIAFALRFIDGMELTEVAAASSVSLATVKRRLARAQQHFLSVARDEPALSEWIEAGRWRSA